MTDDFLTREWTDHRQQFSGQLAAAIRAALTAMRIGFERLNAKEFDAPWKREVRAERC